MTIELVMIMLSSCDHRSRFHCKNAVILPHGSDLSLPMIIDHGTVRSCIYLPDGQRVVVDFAFAGEVIGTAPLRQVTVEAVTTTWTHDWSNDDAIYPDEAHIQSSIMARAIAALATKSRHHVHARMAAFLIGLMDRGFGESFALPMPHTDIGDHLGMTVYTASRILSDFRREGLIALTENRVMRLERSALEAIADQGGQFRPLQTIGMSSERVH